MQSKAIILVPLYLLVLFGLVSAAQISYANFAGVACPHIMSIPVCYVVLASYALMLGALIINHSGCRHHFFCAGWGVAFVIASLASLAELFTQASVCPMSASGGIRMAAGAGIPLCYISWLVLVVILILFIHGPYRNTCAIHNAKD